MNIGMLKWTRVLLMATPRVILHVLVGRLIGVTRLLVSVRNEVVSRRELLLVKCFSNLLVALRVLTLMADRVRTGLVLTVWMTWNMAVFAIPLFV